MIVSPAYRGSRVYAAGERAGARASRSVVALFAQADRYLEASLAGRLAAAIADLARGYASGSVLLRLLWPFARMAVVPFGEGMGTETVLGLLLALACLAPTEILMVGASGVFAIVLWARARAVRRGESASLWVMPPFGMVISVAVVLAFIVGATASSVDPSRSLFNMLIWFFYFLIFFMVADAGFRGRAEHIVWPLLTATAFSGLVGVYQKMTGFVQATNWVDASFQGEIVRVVGTLVNPIYFGEMMGMALPLTIALILTRKDWRDRLALLGFSACQGIGLLLSGSRGAWLGFVISFCVIAVFYDWRMLPVGVVAGVLGFVLSPEILVKRLMSSFSLADSSNAYRVSIWRGSLAILKDHLFRGVGLGAESFAKIYPDYTIVQTPTAHSHSTFLQFLIEVGLFGFIAMGCLFLTWTWDGMKAAFAEKGGAGKRWAAIGLLAACIGSVAGNLLQGIIDYTWYSPRITVVFWATVGLGSGIALSLFRRAAGPERGTR